ncbi:MAG: hypothetical protein ABW189_00625 [Rickettsiales bacterium]
MRKLIVSLAFLLLGGCSVYMAANQESKKDTSLLSPGTPRSVVIGEFGPPNAAEQENGRRVDYYSFVQGYSKGNKVARAVGHGTMDVLTFGLWEVVGTPSEAVFDGKKTNVEIKYDANDKIEKVNMFQARSN